MPPDNQKHIVTMGDSITDRATGWTVRKYRDDEGEWCYDATNANGTYFDITADEFERVKAEGSDSLKAQEEQ